MSPNFHQAVELVDGEAANVLREGLQFRLHDLLLGG